ncbi:hypothetical protein [Butyrivibrio proteoclasticus]|nr:hypothetical protein [Butyrivibrio proteoclasticus]
MTKTVGSKRSLQRAGGWCESGASRCYSKITSELQNRKVLVEIL